MFYLVYPARLHRYTKTVSYEDQLGIYHYPQSKFNSALYSNNDNTPTERDARVEKKDFALSQLCSGHMRCGWIGILYVGTQLEIAVNCN